MPDEDKGIWVLKGCPSGHHLLNYSKMEHRPSRPERRIFDPAIQQCVACLPGLQYVIDQSSECETCPMGILVHLAGYPPGRYTPIALLNLLPFLPGATCDGSSLTPKVVDSIWQQIGSKLRVAACPPGHVLIRLYSVRFRWISCI